MRRFVTVLLLGLVGCNGVVAFRTGFQPTFHTFLISGFVSIVQLSTMTRINGTVLTITTVTFLQPGTFLQPAATISFCGNLVNQFFVDAFTTVEFTQGVNCAAVAVITTG